MSFACRMQKSVALSSGEAELNAQLLGATEGMGVRNVLEELGIEVDIRSHCDSSAARGVLNRQGVGKVRHLQLKDLWLQERTASGELTSKWVPRERNPADLLTHATSVTEFWRNLGLSVATRRTGKGLEVKCPRRSWGISWHGKAQQKQGHLACVRICLHIRGLP